MKQMSGIFFDAYFLPINEEIINRDQLIGVWVTTKNNIDFPAVSVYESGFDVLQFKNQFRTLIETCLTYKINTLFFQVRPEGDAFYCSSLNPWSRYLSGKQGEFTFSEEFDPLKWMIATAKQSGLQFHAWLNPYRLTVQRHKELNKDDILELLCHHHYAVKNPEWTYVFDGRLFLNPGIPQVTNFICETVIEIIGKYEVDGIHFDDYFYPYPYKEQERFVYFKDSCLDEEAYFLYNDQHLSIESWREANINNMVEKVSQIISNFNAFHQKKILFGISPFGVWAHKEDHFDGSATTASLSSLSEYVNTKKWIEEEWLDYIIPQLYWSMENENTPFKVLCHWWNDVVAGSKTKLYIGLGLYQYEDDEQWTDSWEIIKQINYLQSLSHIEGFVFFTYHYLCHEKATRQVTVEALTLIEQHL